jgi:hypothetical protein
MFDVLHPTKPEMMSYDEYRKFALDLNCARLNDALPGRCPVCKREMKVRAGKAQANAHFYHNDNLFCPTKDAAARPYLNLKLTNPDAVVVQANKSFAADNIDLIYSKLKSIVPCLDFMEFIKILKEAKRLNVYGYANAVSAHLPYVYVTLINFLPQNSYNKKRNLKFCFFYDATIQSYEELWINRGFSSDLFRISYSNNKTQKVKKIEISTDYLSETSVKKMTDKQKQWCYSIL